MNNPTFSKRYLITNEVFNAVTHGIGALLSIAGLVALVMKGVRLDSPLYIVTYVLYGSSMILLFLCSTLFHSLIFTKAKSVLQIFDHSSIFLLIAGSYTPICLLTIKGTMGWTLFTLVWVIAIGGIVFKIYWLRNKHDEKKSNIAVTSIYIIMGWLCLIAVKSIYHGLGTTGTLLLVAGGVAYTVGAAFYSLKNVKFMHVVWHLFVLLGAGFMYFTVLFFT